MCGVKYIIAAKASGNLWEGPFIIRVSINSMDYYNEKDLGRFGEIAKYKPELFEKFLAWYQACQEEGELTKREKTLIGLAVAVTVQCPYCIDSFTNSCLENGSNMDQMTEAVHLASAIRGGASLIHGIQAHNAHDKISM